MRFSVVLEPITDPGSEGWYQAHVPALDLVTHGEGIQGAIDAATDLVRLWVGERRARGEPVPVEDQVVFAPLEIDDAVHAA